MTPHPRSQRARNAEPRPVGRNRLAQVVFALSIISVAMNPFALLSIVTFIASLVAGRRSVRFKVEGHGPVGLRWAVAAGVISAGATVMWLNAFWTLSSVYRA